MGLADGFAKVMKTEFDAAKALVSSSLYDLLKVELKELKLERINFTSDASYCIRCSANGLKSAKEEDGKVVTEERFRNAFFDQFTSKLLSTAITQVDVIFDTGLHLCKVEESRKRQGRDKDGKYDASVIMENIKDDLAPAKLANSKHLISQFLQRACIGTQMLADLPTQRKTRVSCKEGFFEAGPHTDHKWLFAPHIRPPHKEADIEIMRQIVINAPKCDAFVVQSTDGDFVLLLMLLLHFHPKEMEGKPVFLLRHCPGGHDHCVNISIFYKYWMKTYKNLWTFILPAMLCGCDPTPFNKKVLMAGIGDNFIFEACRNYLREEVHAKQLNTKEGYVTALTEIHLEAVRLKGSEPRKANVIPRSDEWEEMCRATYTQFCAITHYWNAEEVDEKIWDVKAH